MLYINGYTWDLENGADEPVCREEMETQTQRWTYGHGGGGGTGWGALRKWPWRAHSHK